MRGLQVKASKDDQTQEPASNSGGRVMTQTQAVELLTDDNESIRVHCQSHFRHRSNLRKLLISTEMDFRRVPQQLVSQGSWSRWLEYHCMLMCRADDGRIDINIDSRAQRLSRLFTPALQSEVQQDTESIPPFSALSGDAIGISTPKLNVVI